MVLRCRGGARTIPPLKFFIKIFYYLTIKSYFYRKKSGLVQKALESRPFFWPDDLRKTHLSPERVWGRRGRASPNIMNLSQHANMPTCHHNIIYHWMVHSTLSFISLYGHWTEVVDTNVFILILFKDDFYRKIFKNPKNLIFIENVEAVEFQIFSFQWIFIFSK